MLSRPRLLALSLLAGTCLATPNAAFALNGPANIDIDGGPLGQLEISGGIDGYFYAQSGTSNVYPSPVGAKTTGAELQTFEFDVKKTTGFVNYELQLAGTGNVILGASAPSQASFNVYSTGPLRVATVTFNFTPSFNVTVGQFGSLEGYEGQFVWGNPVGLQTVIFADENANSRGIEGSYTLGNNSLTVAFGDGNDTGVFNFLQFLDTYTINSNNNINLYGGVALGKTGPFARYYGGNTVGNNENFVNGNVFGGWYSTTIGNLSLTPEVQYDYSPAYHKYAVDGYDIPKESSTLGVATFAQYNFGTSPYSLGGFVEYATSHGPATWFVAPNAQLFGIAVAPTWQYKDIYARANVGYAHLLNGGAYGNNGTGKDQVIGTLEAGLVF